MIPIVREFFRGLKERDELDAIIPELLTAIGFEVISRPMVGTRQYGADVAAVGADEDGIRKLFLFSIKKGDLNRREWDGDAEQALRPSLNEIKDAYLAGVAPAHKGLPVVICIAIGGVVLENVQRTVNGFMQTESKDGIELRLWTGDTLTGKIVDGALREEVFPIGLRSRLRRAAALVQEPDAAFDQFSRLVQEVASDDTQDPVSRVLILYLALWILTVWGREAGNLEAPYRASEYVTLKAWHLLWPSIERDNGRKLSASHSFLEIVQLHLRIWDELYVDKILPHAASLHALSFAVQSHESLDVNLGLFETLGRVAMGGLWRAWLGSEKDSGPAPIARPDQKLEQTATAVAAMIENNPALCTPACDDQGIDMTLALMLLSVVPATQANAAYWVSQTANAIMLSYLQGGRFPVIETEYTSLIRIPAVPDEERRKELTAASILHPMLAAFAVGFKKHDLVADLASFQKDHLAHCNYQVWVPNTRSEARIWEGERNGSSLGSLKIGDVGEELMSALRREIEHNSNYSELSAIKLDHWPVLLLACRFYRLPPPPQLWFPMLGQLDTDPVEWVMQRRTIGGLRRVRWVAYYSTSRFALLAGTPSLQSSPPVENVGSNRETVGIS